MAEAPKSIPTNSVEEPVEEILPQEIVVKNVSKSSVYLTYGEIKPGENGKCSKSDYENFAGVYLEKA